VQEEQWQEMPQEHPAWENGLTMTATAGTNLFNSPSGTFRCAQFPFLFARRRGDFLFRCRVKPEFRAVYDLGSVVVWDGEERWLKLAYEQTDAGYPAIVSVVTNGTSDDCNGPRAEGPVWLQVARQGDTFAMHYSLDGARWLLARICRLPMHEEVRVGLSAQCPQGAGCLAAFDHLLLTNQPYRNLRKPE